MSTSLKGGRVNDRIQGVLSCLFFDVESCCFSQFLHSFRVIALFCISNEGALLDRLISKDGGVMYGWIAFLVDFFPRHAPLHCQFHKNKCSFLLDIVFD